MVSGLSEGRYQVDEVKTVLLPTEKENSVTNNLTTMDSADLLARKTNQIKVIALIAQGTGTDGLLAEDSDCLFDLIGDLSREVLALTETMQPTAEK